MSEGVRRCQQVPGEEAVGLLYSAEDDPPGSREGAVASLHTLRGSPRCSSAAPPFVA